MSDNQLGWDRMREKDRVSPREIAEADNAQFDQRESEEERQPQDEHEQWVPPGNKNQGSRKD